MPLPYPRPVPPQIAVVVGDDELIEVDTAAGGVCRLRPARPGRAVLVLHARPPDQRQVADELERLFWLGGRAGSAEVLASGRAEEGDEVAVIRMAVGALPATHREHGVDPGTVAVILGEAVRDVHLLPVEGAVAAPTIAELRLEASHRVSHGLVSVRPDGPYRSEAPVRLLATFDSLLDDLPSARTTIVHGGPTLEHLWIAPDQSITLTGWSRTGTGDPHRDLAVACRSLAETFGPAVVAPFLDAYGLDDVDLRRLDAHQLLDHLLT